MTEQELADEAAKYGCVPKRDGNGMPIPATAEHDKCFSASILCSNPPMIQWICRKCMTCGQDEVELTDSNDNEYGRLMTKRIKSEQA